MPDSFRPIETAKDTSQALPSTDSFRPLGTPMPKEQLDTILVEDKNMVIGMPKGLDLDEINMNVQVAAYSTPKEDFFLGVQRGATKMLGGLGAEAVRTADMSGMLRREGELLKDAETAQIDPMAILTPNWQYEYAKLGRKGAVGILGASAKYFRTLAEQSGATIDESTEQRLKMLEEPDKAFQAASMRLGRAIESTLETYKLGKGRGEGYEEGKLLPEAPSDPFIEDLQYGIGQATGSALKTIGLAYLLRGAGVSQATATLVPTGLMSLQMKSEKYKEYREAGLDHDKAETLSTVAAVVEGGLEQIGLDKFMGAIRGSKVIQRIAARAGIEAIQEMSQTVGEAATDLAAGLGIDPAQLGYEILLSGILGGAVGGGFATAVEPAEAGSAFGKLREKYNLTTEQTSKVVETIQSRHIGEVTQHLSKNIATEAAGIEVKAGPQETKAPADDDIVANIAYYEELLEIRTILGMQSDQFESPEEVSKYAKALDKEIARVAPIVDQPLPTETVRFSRPDQNLVAMHNLSEDSLIHADKMGGLAVPSLSIGKVDHTLSGFGEITLIASKDLIDPQRASNKVFNADIYSPRYPRVRYTENYEAIKKHSKKLEKTEKLLNRSLRADMDSNDFSSKGIKALFDSGVLQYHFLQSKGIEVPIVKKEAKTPSLDLVPEIEKYIGRYSMVGELINSKEFMALYEELRIKEGQRAYDNTIQEGGTEKDAEVTRDMYTSGWYEDGTPNYNILRALQDEIASKEQAGTVDRYATESAIQSALGRRGDLYDEFVKWVKSEFSDLTAKERIPFGEDREGNRKYLQHTLENVVRVMKKELQSGEGFNYGLGNLRASVAKRYRTIREIQADRDKILSPKEFAKAKEATDQEFEEILAEAYEKYEHKKDRGFGTGDTFVNVLIDGIKSGSWEADLKKYGFGNMDMDRIKAFLTTIRNMPTEYFEAKIQRAVSLSEFIGAAVPTTASKEARAILDKHGIKYRMYNGSIAFDRDKAIKELSEESSILFSRGESETGMKAEDVRVAVTETLRLLTPEQEVRFVELAKKEKLTKEEAKEFRAMRDQAAFRNLPIFEYYDTVEEARSGTGLGQIIPEARGFYWVDGGTGRDKIVFIGSNLSPDKVDFVLAHELFGHYGLRGALGNKFEAVLKSVAAKSAVIRNEAKKNMALYPSMPEGEAIEEALADYAGDRFANKETMLMPKWWKAVLSDLKNSINKLGFDFELSEADLEVLLSKSREYVVGETAIPTSAQIKVMIDEYNQAVMDADAARNEAEELEPFIKSYKGIFSPAMNPDGSVMEEWQEAPEYFNAKKDENGIYRTPKGKQAKEYDEYVDEIKESFPNIVLSGNMNDPGVFASELSRIWETYKSLKQSAVRPVMPRIKQKETIPLSQYIAERKAVEKKVAKAVSKAEEKVSREMLGLANTAAQEVQKLKEKITNIKMRNVEERESARQEYARRLDDHIRAIRHKIMKEEAVAESLVEFVEKHLPLAERGRYLRLIKNAGSTPKQIQRAFNRIIDGVQKYERTTLIARIKALKALSKSSKVAVDYQEAVDRILADVDLSKPRPALLARLRSLKDYIKKKVDAGEDPGIPLFEYEALRRLEKIPLAEMSTADLLNLRDRIMALIQIGKTKADLLKRRWQVNKEQALAMLRSESRNLGRAGGERNARLIKTKIGTGEQVSNTFGSIRHIIRSADWITLPMNAFFDMLDGYQGYTGANYRVFKAKLDADFANYLDLRDEMREPLAVLSRKLKISEEGFYRIGIHAALQQENGEQKILARAKTPAQEAEVRAQIAEAIKNLTANELKWYEAARERLDAIKPQIADVMRRVYNQPFEDVKNYFPFMMDFDAMSTSEIEKRFGDKVLTTGGKPKQDVEKGFTKARVGGKVAIRLDAYDIVMKHLDNAAYLVEMGEDIKLLQQVATSQEYQDIVGEDAQSHVVNWLSLLAKKGRFNRENWMDEMRRYTGLYALGFKITTGAIQLTALLDASAEIGHHAAIGIGMVADDKWRKFFLKNVPELRDRIGDDPAYADLSYEAAPQSLGERVKKVSAQTGKIAYGHIKFMDMIAAAATVAGAYNKYMHEKGLAMDPTTPNSEAIKYATRVLQLTQASTFAKDLPAATAGSSLGKLLLQFQTYVLFRRAQYRNAIAGAMRHKTGKATVSAVNKMIILMMSFYAAELMRRGLNYAGKKLTTAILEAMTGKDLPDDDDEKEENALEMFFRGTMDAVPYVSSLYYSGKYGSIPVPAISLTEKLIEIPSSIVKSKKVKTKAKHAARLVAAVPGVLFGGGAQMDMAIKTVFENLD